ncbi:MULTISPECIES: hypothetical protein [Bartonella]|uniref:Uncharacterized protein n=1 Tax=Bartonella grahamii TaxID=33045 RepID=A0A336NIH2_BARGR|nr:hypothetical protein [Bartonella grahamii]SSZ40894.1 Uncharacterised protein [Bartonella grahamii]
MSDKPPLHTFSAICKSKPVYNYTITEQEIKSLQHNNKIETFCNISAGFLTVMMVIIFVWMMGDDDDWKKLAAFGISVVLLLFVVILGGETRSNSEEIWENVKQVSEVICEKK